MTGTNCGTAATVTPVAGIIHSVRMKHFELGNIFDVTETEVAEEAFIDLVNEKNVRIEKIVSEGHRTPDGQWYDQDENEWVIVLKGEAEISFKEGDSVVLKEGGYLNIPAHKEHRVEWTSAKTKTIWLAVFYQ